MYCSGLVSCMKSSPTSSSVELCYTYKLFRTASTAQRRDGSARTIAFLPREAAPQDLACSLGQISELGLASLPKSGQEV